MYVLVDISYKYPQHFSKYKCIYVRRTLYVFLYIGDIYIYIGTYILVPLNRYSSSISSSELSYIYIYIYIYLLICTCMSCNI